ncbi:hypothetical protein A6E15_09435 [Natrinema saccharevitans]|uniref:Uncharacterized protein n=1 Tax=Natrinema saccharevitans TaxID=301967 RepID=A0A1S8AXV2_9EURY|nr:hypothetical protein A6E15_09435 [Natrinema saccharevitans]
MSVSDGGISPVWTGSGSVRPLAVPEVEQPVRGLDNRVVAVAGSLSRIAPRSTTVTAVTDS